VHLRRLNFGSRSYLQRNSHHGSSGFQTRKMHCFTVPPGSQRGEIRGCCFRKTPRRPWPSELNAPDRSNLQCRGPWALKNRFPLLETERYEDLMSLTIISASVWRVTWWISELKLFAFFWAALVGQSSLPQSDSDDLSDGARDLVFCVASTPNSAMLFVVACDAPKIRTKSPCVP
jgi:hypothetical protein